MSSNQEEHNTNITFIDRVIYLRLNRLKNISSLRKTVRNWYTVILFRLGILNSFTLKLIDGTEIRIKNKKDYENVWHTPNVQLLFHNVNHVNVKPTISKNTIKFDWNGKKVLFHYGSQRELSDTLGMIAGVFFDENHPNNSVDVRGKDVINVGGFTADTAIYFALHGARHVYGFEPFPYNFKTACKNIKLNQLSKKITFINEAVGGSRSSTIIPTEYESTASDDLKEFKSGKKIRVTTLEDVLHKFRIDDAVLKMNCEGCEYEVLLNLRNETLRKFKHIILEYHYGYIDLVKRLREAGFVVTYTSPGRISVPETDYKVIYTGDLLASRIETQMEK